jgi:citrate synthase
MTMITAGLAALLGSKRELIPAHIGKNLYLQNMKLVDQQIVEVMENLAVISAAAYCHHEGRTFRNPRSDFSYIENLLYMMDHVDSATGVPYPHHVDCMERLWVLVADHEMTCSTAAFLQTASALPDPVSCLISAISAGYGILHGGAIETAYRNIAEVGDIENVQQKIESVKSGKERLFGYGHRIYRVVDPRSIFIREILEELGEEVKKDPLLRIAFEIDRIASTDEYFTSRKLNPNADLFASFAYKAM